MLWGLSQAGAEGQQRAACGQRNPAEGCVRAAVAPADVDDEQEAARTLIQAQSPARRVTSERQVDL